MAISLASTFYIARTLGPQNFGELSYAQSVIGILALFGALAGSLYRDIVKHPYREGVLLGTAWVVSLATSVVTAFLALSYAFLTPHSILTIWVIALLCLAQFISPFAIIQNVFYAKTETKVLALVNLSIHITISLAKILAMIEGNGVLILASILVLEQLLIAVTYSFMYVKLHRQSFTNWSFNASYAKTLIHDSIPLMIVAGSGAIAARIDQIFIKHSLDIASVGLYGMAVQLSELWQFLPGAILTAFFPAIIHARTNIESYRRRIFSLIGIFIVYGVGISAVMSFLAPTIISFIYGNAFFAGFNIFRIYIWSLTGMIVGFIVQYLLMAENLRRIQIYTAVIPAVINVILNILLIPRLGSSGAAIATVVSYTIAPFIPFCFPATRQTLWQK